jgi:ribosomal protein S18 acetylase RimI-like enzyme
MDDSSVVDTNAQGTGVGARLTLKLSNSGTNKKIVYIVAESNNLQSIHAKAQSNFGA